MRVSCPSCSAGYEIPDHVLGRAGRTLRCARCGTEWAISAPQGGAPPKAAATEPEFVLPPRREPVEEETPMPPPEPIGAVASTHAPPVIAVPEPAFAFDRMLGEPKRATKEARPRDPLSGAGPDTPASVWLGWAGTIILLVALVWCGYVFRTEVMHVWPASERLYALLGMAASSAPLPQ